MVFDCPDQHVICVPCFEIFVKSRLNERQFTIDAETGYYTLGCPVGCENSLITHPKHFLAIISKDDYDRYQRFATEGIHAQHSLIRGVLIQSCSARAKNFTKCVFYHVQFSGVIQNIAYHRAIITKF